MGGRSATLLRILAALLAISGPWRLLAAPADVYCGKDGFKDSKEQEKVCLAQLSELASRKGVVLVLRLDGGATKTIKSNPKACQEDDSKNCLRSHLVGYCNPARLFLVLNTYYEGWDYLLVSARNGAETRLADQPHFARDGSTFVIVNSQQEYAQPYDFAIGTVGTTPPAIIWKNKDTVLGEWEFQRWIDNDHISLSLATETPDCPKPKCEGTLTRMGKEWKLDVLPAKN